MKYLKSSLLVSKFFGTSMIYFWLLIILKILKTHLMHLIPSTIKFKFAKFMFLFQRNKLPHLFNNYYVISKLSPLAKPGKWTRMICTYPLTKQTCSKINQIHSKRSQGGGGDSSPAIGLKSMQNTTVLVLLRPIFAGKRKIALPTVIGDINLM